jgi:hypothetical protein
MAYSPDDVVDYLFLDLKGLTIWLKEPSVFARCYPKEMKVFLLKSRAPKKYAQGLRLKFQCKGFEIETLARNNKVDGSNEFSIWLDKDSAIRLKKFLRKIFPEKLEDFF